MKHKNTISLAVSALALSISAAAAAQEAGFDLPDGFEATLFAEGLVTPRHIVVDEDGDVYVTIRSGQAKFRATPDEGGVFAFRDTDGDGRADMREKFGPSAIDTGLALYDNHLYFASMTDIYAVPLGGALVPEAEPEVVVANLPRSGGGHRTKPITITPDGTLYTQVGSPSNSCQAEDGRPGSAGEMPCSQLEQHGGVFRFSATERNQDGTAGERYSTGHRNVVAMEWNETAGDIFLLMHGRDQLNQLWPEHYTADEDIEQPAEEFHRLEQGDDLGWPYTYWDPERGERMVMPEYGGDGDTVAEQGRYNEPLIAFPGHWAPNDIIFYRGSQFPAHYRNGAFIAFHGAVVPRREEAGGYNVVFVPMNEAGEMTGEWEPFAEAFEMLDPRGRPSGLAEGPDGSLYIVDDTGGRIWKVRYTGE